MRTITDLKLIKGKLLGKLVEEENLRQLNKWGLQSHTPAEWMLFVTEEVGELAEAISECEYRDGMKTSVIDEAIQAATLLLKIAEMYLGELP